ncbi:AAA family ATPase [Sphingomonas sp. 1P08PE]|uniref:AAA family ATPase n=1 Tax=Sphingomonas sp. 1P08PE TaxID=554122 RepID=UPI0039A3524F
MTGRALGSTSSGIAAEKLEEGSRIPSRTIASIEMDWAKGRDLPSPRDILVMDEAGMVGTRQMARVLAAVEQGGARIVLVGDAEQLQAIEAGAAFRTLTERHGAVEISAVRRQRENWQRQATRWLATGRSAQAIDAYAAQGMVHAAATRDEARTALIAGWNRERIAAHDKTRIILTHTNAEVRDLNEAARAVLRAGGALGDDVTVKAARGERAFATGDRIMFLRNERGLGTKNGTLGQVDSLSPDRMAVRLDDGRSVAFDVKHYADVDHGYAATIHKAQGMTVDGAHVLATPGLDRHAAYVALSRHRDGVQLHYGRDDFADMGRLVRTLSRERAKDMASDHLPTSEFDADRAFAERREIWLLERFARKVVERARSIFAGVRWPDGAERAQDAVPTRDAGRLQTERVREPERGRDERLAVERFARAWSAIERTQAQGCEALPRQRQALTRAGGALDAIRAEGSTDLASAFGRDPELVRKAADGGGNEAVRAMRHEAEARADPFLRAERFIEGWQDLQRDRDQLVRDGDLRAARKADAKMTDMARGLDRDRVMAAILLGGGHDDRIDVDVVRSAARADAHTPDHAAGRDAGDREHGFDR